MFELVKSTQEFLNRYVNSTLVVDGITGRLTSAAMTTAIRKLDEAYTTKGHRIDSFNLLFIRTNDVYTDRFTDWGVVFTSNVLYAFPASTKPGKVSVIKNLNLWVQGKRGVAVLKPGQYVNAYSLQTGWWSGLPFFFQNLGDVTIYRDGNTDDKVDKVEESTGRFGINVHSWAGFWGDVVGNLSEGCMVTRPSYMTAVAQLAGTTKKTSYTLTLMLAADVGLQ